MNVIMVFVTILNTIIKGEKLDGIKKRKTGLLCTLIYVFMSNHVFFN